MKPLLRSKHLWGHAAELPELRDHVRLVGITEFHCDLGPVKALAAARVGQPRLESREPAVKLGYNTDGVAEHPGQVLSRNSRRLSQALHRQTALLAKHPSSQPRHIQRDS